MSEQNTEKPSIGDDPPGTRDTLRKLLRLVARRVVERLKQTQADQQIGESASPRRKSEAGDASR